MATVGTSRTARAMTPTVRAGLAWAFVGVLLFSFSVPMTKVAVGGFSPFFTAMGRAVIAGALALLLLAVRRVPFPAREHLKPILFTTIGAVFGWPILLALALQRTTSAPSTRKDGSKSRLDMLTSSLMPTVKWFFGVAAAMLSNTASTMAGVNSLLARP